MRLFEKNKTMKNLKTLTLLLLVAALSFASCEEDDSTEPAAPAANNNGTNNPTDTTSVPMPDQFWLGTGAVKCTPYTKGFTGFINLLSVNTEKCYQESVRPNFTFDFVNSGSSFTFGAGTYNIIPNGTTASVDTDVVFSMSGYNNKSYTGVSGTVNITKSTSDSTKWVAEWNQINIYSSTDSANYTFSGRIDNF